MRLGAIAIYVRGALRRPPPSEVRLKYFASEGVENKIFQSNFSLECGIAQRILALFVFLSKLTA